MSRIATKVKRTKPLGLSRREARTGLAFIGASLFGFLLFYFLPIGLVIKESFSKPFGGGFAWFDNYINIWKSEAFRLGMWNTLRFTVIAIPLMLLLAFGLALLLYRRQKSALRTWIVLPLVIPTASIVQFFFIIFAEEGITNRVLGWLGLSSVNWLESGATFWVLIALYIWKNIGYTVILLMAGLNSIPPAYAQAAQSDGADRKQCMRYITLPLMLPTFFFVLIIALIRSFQVFREAYMITGAYPADDGVYMLPHFLNNNFKSVNFQQLSVATVYMLVLIGSVVYLLYKLRNKREAEL